MKQVTKYIADDGIEFTDKLDCINHEINCEAAKAIMAKMPERQDSCDFSNGSGYIQHDKAMLLVVRNEFLEFVKRYTDFKWIQQTIDMGFDADASWAGRIIGESAPATISRHWQRFSCIDNKCREWGQPYYATHPGKAKQVRLN